MSTCLQYIILQTKNQQKMGGKYAKNMRISNISYLERKTIMGCLMLLFILSFLCPPLSPFFLILFIVLLFKR